MDSTNLFKTAFLLFCSLQPRARRASPTNTITPTAPPIMLLLYAFASAWASLHCASALTVLPKPFAQTTTAERYHIDTNVFAFNATGQ